MAGYRKTLDRLVDFVKALSAGSFVASFVGFFLQQNKSSWAMLVLGIFLFSVFVVMSVTYDRRFENE